MSGFPCYIGRITSGKNLAMAERAIEAATKAGVRGPPASFSVSVELSGLVSVDRSRNSISRFVVATFNHKSDPDWLADEIAFAARDWS